MSVSPEQLEQIIKQQMDLKKSPEDIFVMAQSANIAVPEITSVFMNMGLPLPAFNNINNLKKENINADRESYEIKDESDTSGIWDPLHETIEPETFVMINQSVQKKIDRFIANPKIVIRNLLIASIPGMIVLGFYIFSFDGIFEQIGTIQTPDTDGTNKVQEFSGLNIQWIFFAFFPAGLYWAYVSNFQRDSIKLMVAQKKGWLYNSGQSFKRWQKFAKRFPEFFNKSGHAQQMEDQFWGKVEDKDFYAANFKFITGNGKNKQTHYYNVVALKLPIKNIADFQLKNKKPYTWRPFEGIFGPKKIQTESVDFNNNFSVLYQDSKEINQDLEITKTLSPVVQEALVRFKKEAQIESILFRDGILFFQFYGRLLPKIYTNFFKDMKLDDRDMNAVESKILKIIEIGKGIIKYLD